MKPSTWGCTVVDRRDLTVATNSVVSSTGVLGEGHRLDRHGGPARGRRAPGATAGSEGGEAEGQADEAPSVPNQIPAARTPTRPKHITPETRVEQRCGLRSIDLIST